MHVDTYPAMELKKSWSYCKIWKRLTRVTLITTFVAFIILIVQFNAYSSHKAYHGVTVKLPKHDHAGDNAYSASLNSTTLAYTKKAVTQDKTSITNQTVERKLNFTREYLATIAPDILNRVPTRYLPTYRSFCWFEGDQLWCLPYFYIIGFHKCGTTDIFDKLELHPSVLKVGKEPHWWALRRAGLRRKNYSLHEKLIAKVQRDVGNVSSFSWYLHWFKHQHVLTQVENTTRELASDEGELTQYHPYVFGDGSVSTLTSVIYDPWDELIPNGRDPEILPYLMHAVQPHARIIITVRDPVQRFTSMYSRKVGGHSAALHQYAISAVKCASECIANDSVRQCAYFSHCLEIPQIYLGIYIEFIRPWAMVYGKDNLLILRMEDRIENPVPEFKKIIQYLDLETLPDEQCKRIMQTKVFNTYSGRKTAMLKETRTLLQNFYRPFNRQLAAFMQDDGYNFGY